ncbi:MAG: DUF3365 domain-containing protein [Planctomycetales bacterium]|nr:DUF3365 domain-containing protein [Planctomycetales bacterium]
MKFQNRTFLAGALAAVVAAGALSLLPVNAADDQDAAVERTRKTVRMLDDVYKTAVVLITEHYVNDDKDLPAGAAAIALFDAIKKKGWHEVKLLDVSGEPYDDDNVAKDAFEKEAVKQMKSGKAWYDKVVAGENGNRTLRVATPIPVVMEKCTMCHPNYKQAKKGEAIGMLSYQLTVE